MSDLHIEVSGYAGASIPDLIRHQCALAARLEIDVHAKWNGVTVIASPGDDAGALCKAWDEQLMRQAPEYAKIACLRAK